MNSGWIQTTASLYLLAAAVSLAASDFPEAEISNGDITARFYLPDPEQGYYRGTRFDWSGVIYSLRTQGHEYFGQWFEKYDPELHDAIMGPVEEFKTNDAGLGFDEALPGETFIRIGVGVVRRPDREPYKAFKTYEIVESGKWTVEKGKDWIRFVHLLSDGKGYGYRYRKTIRLMEGKAGMTIEHSLQNTGTKPIHTSQYNHNFFVIDGQPTGPDAFVEFPFDLRPLRPFKGDAAEVSGRRIVYTRELTKGESVYGQFEGFGKSPTDYDIRVEHRKAGAGVRISGDRPLSRLVFWSIRSTFCPEPYIDLQVEPGAEALWNYTYEFYALPARKQ